MNVLPPKNGKDKRISGGKGLKQTQEYPKQYGIDFATAYYTHLEEEGCMHASETCTLAMRKDTASMLADEDLDAFWQDPCPRCFIWQHLHMLESRAGNIPF